ncbi:hypothetical protein QJQ45_022922 [Haematococcus lacustris]|nr:hypothetical protein QJQ45_022922 [Haematococcus lacustris]
MRLVCKQLRAAIDDAVSSLDIALKDSDDPDEVLQRLARTSLRPSKLYLEKYSGTSTQPTLLLAALVALELVPVLHGVQHLTLSAVLPLSAALVDECSLAACTQLTELYIYRWFPALTQLTQLQQLEIIEDLASDSLPLLATLPQLADLRLLTCPLHSSSQLSRFLFQHLTSLTVDSIHSRDLAALDCPQLQTLDLSELQVDSAASLRACANGILQHCNAIYKLFTYDHGQEFKSAAAGAEVRQLGPPPSASALLEALAPWQPRSGGEIEELGLCHLPNVSHEALEWLPVNIKSLTPRSASFTWVLLAWAFACTRYHHHQLYDKLGEAVLQGLQGSHLMPRLQQASRAAPPHPSSSSSSSVAATHSSPASLLPSNPLARGPPQPSPLPTPLAQLSSTCLVQLLWAFASHQHCQAALLRAAAPVLSARILQGQLSSRRVACVAWAYARLQQLEPRLVSAILRHSMAHAEQYELRYWARLAWAFSTLGLASEEAYHQRLARLMQERQQQLQRPTPAAGAQRLLVGHVQVDEGSLAASTQLTELDGINWFPGLTQLTQLQQLDIHGFFYSGSLPLLATLPQLADLRLQSCLLWPSSQLSRFLFQHLTSLTVGSIHSRDLAALDCPQLQTLSVRQLLVDCEASLRTCANGILQDCSSLCRLLTYDHGQESLRAAADDVRQLGPPPSASALLEALAPWQPRSGKAIEELGLWHIHDVTRKALEWLPVNIKSLTFQFCRLMPGALSSVATRLTQLTCLDLTHASVDPVELQLLAARAQQGDVIDNATVEEPECPLPCRCPSVPGLAAPTTAVQPYSDPDPPRSASFTWVLLAWAFACTRYHHHQLYDKLGEAVLQGLQGSHLMPRLQQASRAAPPQHLSSSSSSVAATHSRSGHGILAWAFSTLGLASEEAYHQRLARLMQERQQQLQRPNPAAGAVAAAQRPSRLQQRGRGHTAAPAARPGAGQGPRCPSSAAFKMLSDMLHRFPGIGSAVYQHLDADSRRAMRLVCKQLRAAIDDAVSSLFIGLNDSYDPDEVLQRLARTSLRPSKLHFRNFNTTQTTLLLAALAARELVPVLHEVQHLTMSSIMPLSAALVSCFCWWHSPVMSSTMPQLRSLYVVCHMDVSVCRAWQRLPQLSSLTLGLVPASDAAAASPLLEGLEHITSMKSLNLTYLFFLKSLNLTESYIQVDEGSLAACKQLTKLIYERCFPALTQLTQLLQLEVVQDLSSDSLPLLATLPQLADLRLQSCPLQPSSQLSRFLFQNLTSLTVKSIHSRDLAALDCPQLQTLAVHELLVDCAASLRACASGILQHCCDVSALSTYNHGQEFKAAAAGAVVRQLGPPPSVSVLLEALAPWQPRSGAVEKLGLWHLSDVTHEALEWLPVNIKSLTFQSCHLLPGALSSVATRLTQLTCLDLSFSHVSVMELQLLAARAQQGALLKVYVPIALSEEEVAALETFTAYTKSWTGHTPIVIEEIGPLANLWSPASPLPSKSLARGPPQPSPLPTPLAQLSSTCLVQLLWAFASHEHCQAALLRGAAPVLSARILQGQLSSRRVACVAWAYARLQQLEPRLLSAILSTGGRPGQLVLRCCSWARPPQPQCCWRHWHHGSPAREGNRERPAPPLNAGVDPEGHTVSQQALECTPGCRTRHGTQQAVVSADALALVPHHLQFHMAQSYAQVGFSKQQVELVIQLVEDVLVGQQDLNLITSFYQFTELLDVQCADSYEEHVCNSGKTGTPFCPGHTYDKIPRSEWPQHEHDKCPHCNVARFMVTVRPGTSEKLLAPMWRLAYFGFGNIVKTIFSRKNVMAWYTAARGVDPVAGSFRASRLQC